MANFSELFDKGGPLMWPLLFCSILALAVVLERSVFFLRTWRNYRRFIAELLPLVANRRIQAALDFLRGRPDPPSVLASCHLANLEVSPRLRENVLQRVGGEQMERIERRLGVLAGLAHLCPLLGLFGTVLGMIDAFRHIQELEGQADVAALAGGIWEALVTTAFGLAIAIPAAAAYHYFDGLATRQAGRMENVIGVLNETLGMEPAMLRLRPSPTPEGDTENVAL